MGKKNKLRAAAEVAAAVCLGSDSAALLATPAPTVDQLALERSILSVSVTFGIFMCLVCNRNFKTVQGRSSHYLATGHGIDFEDELPAQCATRRRRSFREKRGILNLVRQKQMHFLGDETKAKKFVSRKTGVSVDLLGRWLRQADFIYEMANTRKMGGKKSYTPLKSGKWHDAEVRLYVKFIYRRRFQALRVTRHWLRRNFKICRAEMGHNVDGWFPSDGWCTRFCRRFEITSQCRTNKKKFSIEERLPKIRGFHQYWIYGVQHTGPQRCPKYGRYPPGCIYSMDQVPMPFANPSKRSLNEKGAPRGCRFTAASEKEKRFCTIQVTLCADVHDQDVPIEVIFRSGTRGARIPKSEKEYYATNFPNVKVRWQKKAWADEAVCLDYIVDFREHTARKGEVALIMDRHGSQSTERIIDLMKAFDVRPIFTPAGCTDCVSPVDRNIGMRIKDRVYKIQDLEMDLDENRNWALPAKEGGLGDPGKRKLIVRWLSQVWTDFQREEKHMLLSAFTTTGCLIAKDGSENHLIRLWPTAPEGAYNFAPPS